MHIDIPGPDFLDNVADVESGNGMHINANEYRKRADEWREHERQLEAAHEQIDRLTADIVALRKSAFTAAEALTKIAAPAPITSGATQA